MKGHRSIKQKATLSVWLDYKTGTERKLWERGLIQVCLFHGIFSLLITVINEHKLSIIKWYFLISIIKWNLRIRQSSIILLLNCLYFVNKLRSVTSLKFWIPSDDRNHYSYVWKEKNSYILSTIDIPPFFLVINWLLFKSHHSTL